MIRRRYEGYLTWGLRALTTDCNQYCDLLDDRSFAIGSPLARAALRSH